MESSWFHQTLLSIPFIHSLPMFLAKSEFESPLAADAPFSRVASVLRVSLPQQLNFPSLHKLARQLVETIFPSGPVPFFHPDCLEEALALATEYQITSVSIIIHDLLPLSNLPPFERRTERCIQIQKGIFYSLVTTSNFDTEGGSSSDNPVQPFGTSLPPAPFDHENEQNPEQDDKLPKSTSNTTSQPKPQHRHVLSAANSRRCTQLMTQLINHFTPLLFTPAATPHMACTDVFADTWMRLVIQPALEDDGVYKPLETLERMRGVDWAKEGLCESCVREKMEEWRGEQEEVWRLMDKWLGLEKTA